MKKFFKSEKREKHTVNITEWKNNSLEIYDIAASSLEDAMNFISTLTEKCIYAKVYNKSEQLVHSANYNMSIYEGRLRDEYKKHHGHEHHGHHGHDDDDDSYA